MARQRPSQASFHHSDDEAWHVLEGELIFRYSDRTTETISAGKTVFVPAGVAHIYTAGPGARYLIVLTPRLRALIAALEADREPASRKYTDASIPSFGSSESSRQERSHLLGSNILNRLRSEIA